MVKIQPEDIKKVNDTIKNRPLTEMIKEIEEDKGSQRMAEIAMVGLESLDYFYGLIAMYLVLKSAWERVEIDKLEDIFKKGGKR